MKKGLFFDCDGVLVDTKRANYFSYLSALENVLEKQIGERFTFDFYEKMYGKSWREWLPGLAEDKTAEVHRLKIQIYGSHLKKYGEPLAGLAAIEYWQKREIPIAIVSNSSAHSIKSLIEWLDGEFNIRYLREVPVFTPSETLAAKPHPALIREARIKLQVDSGILIDDDRQIGALTAQNAEVHFVHYAGKLDALNQQIEALL